jgi:hypothetical protein
MRAGRIGSAVATAFLALALAGAGAPSRLYRNEAMRVRSFEAPSGWEQAPQSSYPRLLTSFTHADGGRITLTAQRVAPGTTPAALVAQSRPALERQGFFAIHVISENDRVRLEASLDGGKRVARQVYLVEAGIAYVVTLVAPQALAAAMTRDFDFALRSLRLGGDERSDADAGVTR